MGKSNGHNMKQQKSKKGAKGGFYFTRFTRRTQTTSIKSSAAAASNCQYQAQATMRARTWIFYEKYAGMTQNFPTRSGDLDILDLQDILSRINMQHAAT